MSSLETAKCRAMLLPSAAAILRPLYKMQPSKWAEAANHLMPSASQRGFTAPDCMTLEISPGMSNGAVMAALTLPASTRARLDEMQTPSSCTAK